MVLARLYRFFLRKKPPYYLEESGAFLLAWKPVRKFINVVVAPIMPFTFLRIFLYRIVGFKIGRNCFIGMRCYLDDIDPSMTTIGDNVVISYCCKFAVHGRGQGHRPITIKDRAYIGLGAIILSGKDGIEIGEGAIIGAGSLVRTNIPARKMAVGVPARILRDVPES